MSNEIRVEKFFQRRKIVGGEVRLEDWVSYRPPVIDGQAPSVGNEERVDRLNPANLKFADGVDNSFKVKHMSAIWSVIGPAYEAWKEGREMPEHGTPLATWPAISNEEAEIFRMSGIKTVEQVAELTENAFSRIRIANLRELRSLAKMFLDNHGAAKEAAEKAEMQAKINALMARIEQLEKAPEPVTDRVTELRAVLDELGVSYDKRWGEAKLEQALIEANAKEEAA